MGSSSSLRTFPSELSHFVSHCTEARVNFGFLVLSYGQAQPSPAVVSPVSVSQVPLRSPDRCHRLLQLVRGSSGLPNLLARLWFGVTLVSVRCSL